MKRGSFYDSMSSTTIFNDYNDIFREELEIIIFKRDRNDFLNLNAIILS